jgi:hypothetical protein
MEAAPLPEGVLKLLYVVGALLVLPLVGAFLWGVLGGTHQTYRLEDDDELSRMTSRVACRECGNEAESSDGMLPEGWQFTVTKAEKTALRGKPTCPKCLRSDLMILENRKLYDD